MTTAPSDPPPHSAATTNVHVEVRASVSQDRMVREWLGPWSSHPAYSERNLRLWKRIGVAISLGLPAILLALLVTRVLFAAGTQILRDPASVLNSILQVCRELASTLKLGVGLVLFLAPAGMAFALTAMLNNLAADHASQTRGADLERREGAGILSSLRDGNLARLIITAVGLGIGLWALVLLARGQRSGTGAETSMLLIFVMACPVLLELAGAKRYGISPRWWILASLAWLTLSMLAWVQIAGLLPRIVASALTALAIIHVVKRIARLGLGRRATDDKIILAEPDPEILRALPLVPGLPSVAAACPGLAPPPARPSDTSGSAETSPVAPGDAGLSRKTTIDPHDWIETSRSALGLGSWRIENFKVSTHGGSDTSPIAEGNPARALFWAPPTADQLGALNRIRELRHLPAQAVGDRGRDLMIEGPCGSGRTTLLIAAAIDAVLEGHDALLVLPDSSRAEIALAEADDRLARHALRGFLRAGRLTRALLERAHSAGELIPELLVATVEDLEQHLFGAPSFIAGHHLRSIISIRDVVLIDDLVEIPMAARAHLPFVLDKLRLVMHMQANAPQMVVSCPPLARMARNRIAMRLLSTKGEPNRFTLRPAAEAFDLFRVTIESKGLSSDSIAGLVDAAATAIVRKACEAGCQAGLVLPGRPRGTLESIRSSLATVGGGIPVEDGIDGLRLRRDILPGWGRIRAMTDGCEGMVALSAPGSAGTSIVVAFESRVRMDAQRTLHVLPVMPSSSSWTFIARHLRSVVPLLPTQFPLHRDAWARLGLGDAGSLAKLPSGRPGHAFDASLELHLDPCEFDREALESLDAAYWPWACRGDRGATDTAGEVRSPVDFDSPPSFEEALRLLPCGTRVAAGRWGVIARKPGSALDAAGPASRLRPELHRLRWSNDQGRRLGSDGLLDLAYGEDLLFRSGKDVYVAQRIEGRDKLSGELRVTAVPSIGAAGEAQFPIWRGEIRIPPTPCAGQPDCLVRLMGGPLGKFAIRFDLQSVHDHEALEDPELEQRRRQRTGMSRVDISAPEISLRLLGALDTTGTRSSLNADIAFEHRIRGVSWILMRPGLSDEQFEKAEALANREMRGVWHTNDAIPSGGQTGVRAGMCGRVWPELSAALQVGLRATLPGWQHFGRVVAFHPAERPAHEAGVRAIVFFVEPVPTEETVSDAVNSLAMDPDLLHALLERCMLELDTLDNPRQITLQARTCWERVADSDGVSRAAQLLSSMLGLVRPEERPDLVPWIDQSVEGGESLGDIHSGDLGVPPAQVEALVQALDSAGRQDLVEWVRAAHGLVKPPPSLRPLTFDSWQDSSAGDGRTHSIQMQVDAALAESIERHFGVPEALLDRPYMPSNPALAEAWQRIWHRSLLLHGMHHDRMIYASWHVSACVSALRPVAESIMIAYLKGSPREHDDRAAVEAITSYVQNAVPYRRIRALRDGKYRWGFRTPLKTLLTGGDCDSKSMLLICLIRSVRPSLPLALIHIDAGEPHAMLAVGGIARTGEKTKTISGIEHALIESTADWDIGRIGDDADEESITAFRIPPAPAHG
jgi:hypothetical protein